MPKLRIIYQHTALQKQTYYRSSRRPENTSRRLAFRIFRFKLEDFTIYEFTFSMTQGRYNSMGKLISFYKSLEAPNLWCKVLPKNQTKPNTARLVNFI